MVSTSMRRTSWLWRKERDLNRCNSDPPPYTGSMPLPSGNSRVGLHILHQSSNDVVDIVFVHGLGGHWRDTWKDHAAKASWPEQWLPTRVPNSRIMSYGYDSRVTNWREIVSQNSVGDHANNLLRDLSNYREEDGSNNRPLFFVVHSMGGIVIQDAIVRSRHSPDSHIKQIFHASKGIVFLGTPHSGTEALATWARGVAFSLGLMKQTNTEVLGSLRASSEVLYRIQTAFHNMIRERNSKEADRINITCFFEELPLRGFSVIVTKHSASLPAYQATGLHYNHSDMTRFVDASDPGFLAVTADLIRWTKSLPKPADAISEKIDPFDDDTKCDSSIRTIPDFPYSRNADFVGCEAIIDEMNHALQINNRLALNGIGGVGKTEVAAEFCYRYHQDYRDTLIFWIPCDSSIKIDLAFRDIAIRLKLPGHDEPNADLWSLAVQYLSSSQAARWLMVLDNADDFEHMTDGRKALAKVVRDIRNGKVIITTRDRYIARTIVDSTVSIITVNNLSPVDASRLFRSKLPCNSKVDTAVELEILSILEYLPLCITQAAAYLDQSRISMSEYLLELTESESSLIEILDDEHVDLRRGFDTPNSVFRAWKLSFEKIRLRYQQAAELLSIMAFLDRQDIPRSLLKDVIPSRHQLNSALGTLQGFCLIKAEVDHKIFRMHRLVQLATKVWLRNEAQRYQATALRLVHDLFPPNDSEDLDLKRLLLPHGKRMESYTFNEKPLAILLAQLQFKLAACEWHAGQYNSAAVTCQIAYDKSKSLLGEHNIDTLRIGGFLGTIKVSQGLWDEAYTMQSQILCIKESVLGPTHLETIDTLSDLADVQEKQGQFADAEELMQRAYRIRCVALGECHRKTLQSLMSLATYSRRQARYQEAEKLGRQALSDYEKTLGYDHVLTLASAYALAGTLRESGHYKEAVAISHKVVDGRKRLFGDDHPQTLLAVNNLALGQRLDGNLSTAEHLYRKVCATNQKLGRMNHPDCIQACQNLASVLGDLGHFEEAETIARDTLTRRRAVLGAHHLSTMNTAETLAINLEHQGKYSEAEDLATEAYRTRQQRLGASHTYTLDTLFVLGSIKEHTGRISEAVCDFQQVRDGRLKVLGQDHPTTKATLLRLHHLSEELEPRVVIPECHDSII